MNISRICYIDSQFARLGNIDESFGEIARIQLSSEFGKTNYINVTVEQVEAIKRILTGEED